jgi:hypothetical protein
LLLAAAGFFSPAIATVAGERATARPLDLLLLLQLLPLDYQCFQIQNICKTIPVKG